jgi:hypothetical protein
MVEQSLCGRIAVEAKVLRQVPEGLAHFVFLLHDVELAEVNAPFVGILQRGQDAHERRFAGAVRPEEAEHASLDRQGDIAEGADAVGIGLGEVVDPEVEHDRYYVARGRRCTALESIR